MAQSTSGILDEPLTPKEARRAKKEAEKREKEKAREKAAKKAKAAMRKALREAAKGQDKYEFRRKNSKAQQTFAKGPINKVFGRVSEGAERDRLDRYQQLVQDRAKLTEDQWSNKRHGSYVDIAEIERAAKEYARLGYSWHSFNKVFHVEDGSYRSKGVKHPIVSTFRAADQLSIKTAFEKAARNQYDYDDIAHRDGPLWGILDRAEDVFVGQREHPWWSAGDKD